MEINVKLLTESAYSELRKNKKEVYRQIVDHPSDCSWLKGYLGYEPFEEKKYVIKDFALKDAKNYQEVAEENAITLYEALKGLPRYILCNNRFWIWLLFTKFYKQAPKAIDFNENTLITRWLIGESRRELMLGVISRQYFKVEVAVTEGSDKYDLAKFIICNHNPYKNITMRNIGMLKNVVVPYLKICKEMKENYGITLNDEFCSTLMKEASKIGSVMLIDIMDQNEIYDILHAKITEYIREELLMDNFFYETR